MVFVIILMAVILAVCGLIVAYVAFPHRGEELPGVPWLGDAMTRAAEVLPMVGDDEDAETYADH